MKDPQIGWIAAIIIGAVAGWLAEPFMKSDMGLLMNIVFGIIGAAVASAILSVFGIQLGGWLGYLIAGFIGACLLIWIVRAVRGTRPIRPSIRRLPLLILPQSIEAVAGVFAAAPICRKTFKRRRLCRLCSCPLLAD